MIPIEWSAAFETGIDVIDGQHRRIIDHINALRALGDRAEHAAVAEQINGLIEYTYCHFAFEEALMEEVGYEYLAIHRRTHEGFSARIEELRQRFADGEDVTTTLAELLQTWLFSHVRSDDAGFAPLVRRRFAKSDRQAQESWMKGALRRFFSN